jgi:hypothetical protein
MNDDYPRSADYTYKITGATGTAIGTGKANTRAILVAYPARLYKYTAATMCANYRGGGYCD